MASHVVVIDSAARRATVKCNPATYMSDVLGEACQKLKLNPDLYVLRHNKKPLDLSRTYRLAGLPSGAQLELVQASRSPQVVNIALQLPATDDNRRVTDKFPSNTSLWQVLRRFESGVAGGTSSSLNLTQRATPQMQNGTGGSGRLFYDMPVIQVMGRELGSFVDLQKTLAQIGVSGSALLRLAFKNSGLPLEEAMMEISQYFKESEEQGDTTGSAAGAHATSAGEATSIPQPDVTAAAGAIAGEEIPPEPQPMEDVQSTPVPEPTTSTTEPGPTPTPINPPSAPPTPQEEPPSASPLPQPSTSSDPNLTTSNSDPPSRNIRIFHAPSNNTPLAASQSYNPSDYVPTVAHATLHQARLTKEGANRRLASDRELEASQAERKAQLDKIEKVRARIKFPDMESVELDFTREDSAADVYSQVRTLLLHPEAKFGLKLPGARGPQLELLPETEVKVITGLGWRGGLQIHMLWDDGVSAEVRKQPVLAEEWRSKRTHFDRPVEFKDEEEGKKGGVAGGLLGRKGKGKAEGGSQSVEDKMKKFLRFGKK